MARTRRVRRLRRAVAELIADLLDDGHDLDTIAVQLQLAGVPLARADLARTCREPETLTRVRHLEDEVAKVRAALDRVTGLLREVAEQRAPAGRP